MRIEFRINGFDFNVKTTQLTYFITHQAFKFYETLLENASTIAAALPAGTTTKANSKDNEWAKNVIVICRKFIDVNFLYF